MVRTISILGATGSIGASTLDLIRRNRDEWKVVALTANGNAEGLAALAREFSAELAVVADEGSLLRLREELAGSQVETAGGPAALTQAAAVPAEETEAEVETSPAEEAPKDEEVVAEVALAN